MNWLYLANANIEQGTWVVDDAAQVAHIHTQLKLQVGDELKVLLPKVGRYRCHITELSPQQAHLTPLAFEGNTAKCGVHLVLALPRPKVLRRMIMDATSLGVTSISLIHSYRVDKSYWQTPFLQQLDAYVQLGLEQAGDAIAPNIRLFKRFKPFVEDELRTWIRPDCPALLAHPYGDQVMPRAIEGEKIVLIGPEGGFIAYEVDLLKQNGCQVLHLGSRILRTETALSFILGRLS